MGRICSCSTACYMQDRAPPTCLPRTWRCSIFDSRRPSCRLCCGGSECFNPGRLRVVNGGPGSFFVISSRHSCVEPSADNKSKRQGIIIDRGQGTTVGSKQALGLIPSSRLGGFWGGVGGDLGEPPFPPDALLHHPYCYYPLVNEMAVSGWRCGVCTLPWTETVDDRPSLKTLTSDGWPYLQWQADGGWVAGL